MIRCARRQIPPLAAWLGAGRRTPPLVAHPTALERGRSTIMLAGLVALVVLSVVRVVPLTA